VRRSKGLGARRGERRDRIGPEAAAAMGPIRKAIVYGWAGVVGAALVAYVGDALLVRLRLATGGAAKAYDSVTVIPAVALKGEKYEIYTNNGTVVTCSRSLFPQLGDSPCWYVRRHQTDFLN
jgi:hypothetical protein